MAPGEISVVREAVRVLSERDIYTSGFVFYEFEDITLLGRRARTI